MMMLQREGTPLLCEGLCECGYGISCGVSREGERLGLFAFFDAQEASTTYGEQITSCPGCDARLNYNVLFEAAD